MKLGITTFSKEIVEFWEKEGMSAEERYIADGFTCWTIHVPDEHPRIRDPEYIGLLLREKLRMSHVLRTRMKAPLYTIKKDGHYADIQGSNGRGIPLARTKKLLRHFVGADTSVKVVKLSGPDKVRKAVDKGPNLVYYVIDKELCETFSKQEALQAL